MMPKSRTAKLISQAGFTLVELLVVIFILGILATLVVTNLTSARQRARDSRKKAELSGVKKALRLYYNDYQTYPESHFGLVMKGCGPDGDAQCPYEGCEGEFTAGGTDGCATTYMNDFTDDGSYFIFRYYKCTNNDDDFRLTVDLENVSDSDIALSKNRCPEASCDGYSINDDDPKYVMCAE